MTRILVAAQLRPRIEPCITARAGSISAGLVSRARVVTVFLGLGQRCGAVHTQYRGCIKSLSDSLWAAVCLES